jgi:hypothetical protein
MSGLKEPNTAELNKQLKQQIMDLEREQQAILAANKLNVTDKPYKSASDNLKELFESYPVNHRRTVKVKLEEVNSTFTEESQESLEKESLSVDSLFEKIMSSLNPFAQYLIREIQAQQETAKKNWELDESIFNKPKGEVNPDFLNKSSAEMFVIYKYTQDPHMKVKSEKYCGGMRPDENGYIECR